MLVIKRGFLCYDPHIRCIRTSRNVVFFENQYFFQQHLDSVASSSVVSFPVFQTKHHLLNLILISFIRGGVKLRLHIVPLTIPKLHLVQLEILPYAVHLGFQYLHIVMDLLTLP